MNCAPNLRREEFPGTEGAVDDFRPELILFQAGVDAHEADKLGRLALTDAGLEARDRYVAGAARARGIQIASALGGGYGADRWRWRGGCGDDMPWGGL